MNISDRKETLQTSTVAVNIETQKAGPNKSEDGNLSVSSEADYTCHKAAIGYLCQVQNIENEI